MRARIGQWVGWLSLVVGGAVAAVGIFGLIARRGPLAWTSVVVPELAGWFVLPALLAVGLALVASRLRPWREGPGLALGVALGATALTGWPLVAWPATVARSHAVLAEMLGSVYPDALHAPAGEPSRRAPFSARDYLLGIASGASRVDYGIVYWAPGGQEQALDLYRPLTPGPHPVVLALHGGGWAAGSRFDRITFYRYLAARGYAVAAIDYRLAPEWTYPAQLQDVRTAVAFLATHAADYDLDARRVILAGHSAGGHLALLAGYTSTPRMIGNARIAAVVAYYPPTDLLTLAQLRPGASVLDQGAILHNFLGMDVATAAELYLRASPLNFADRPTPPTMLVHGVRDAVVPVDQSRRLAQTLRDAGNTVAYVELPWSGHDFDRVFHGLGHQLFLYELDRFLAWAVSW